MKPLVAKLQNSLSQEPAIYSKQAVVLKHSKNDTFRISEKKEKAEVKKLETDRMRTTDRYFFEADKQEKKEKKQEP
jgi:hypothetical protein